MGFTRNSYGAEGFIGVLLDHAGYNGELTNENDNNTMRAGWEMHEKTASKSPTMQVSWEHHPGNLRQKLP